MSHVGDERDDERTLPAKELSQTVLSTKRKRTNKKAFTKKKNSLEKLVLGENADKILPFSRTGAGSKKVAKHSAKPKHTPAWQDPDPPEDPHPPGNSFSAKLPRDRVKTFETIMGNPQWAKLGRKRTTSSSDEEDDDVLRHAGNLLSRSTRKQSTLLKGDLVYKRNLDLNHATYSEGRVIRAVEFHPTSAVALVGGNSGVVTLYEVNGRTNPKLQSVAFRQFKIDCAKFGANGTEFLVGSCYNHMYCYDMEAGQSTKIISGKAITNYQNFKVSPDGRLIAVVGLFGNIHFLTAQTKELIDTVKMNGSALAISFNSSGTRLYSHGDEGEIYTWDTNTRTCVERFTDEGCLKGTSLTATSRYIAAGSTSGVVNVYASGLSKQAPLKTLLNLRTPITSLAFNPTEEILAMASNATSDGVRLVHLPSFTVFANFPGKYSERELNMPECMKFSPNGGYLAIGNSKNTVILYRLKHYGNY